MRKTVFIAFLLFSVLQAGDTQLNLPEKFDVRVSDWWNTEGKKKIYCSKHAS